jgi:hypothetical protein
MLLQVRKARNVSLKTVVNEALREGLVAMNRPAKRRRFQTKAVDLGRCYLPSLDNIAEVLAVVEGENFH